MKCSSTTLATILLAITSQGIVAGPTAEVPENPSNPENSALRKTSTDIWIQQIQSIGREGSGSDDAGVAVQSLSAASPNQILTLLDAFDAANPIARNLLRGTIESIADAADEPLPISQLVRFVQNRKRHDAHARGLAFALLRRAAPQIAEQLVPTLLHDPNPDLRRIAVALEISHAKMLADQEQDEQARRGFERALSGAIDRDQVAEIVAGLERFGVTVDLQHHFGFITRWRIIGPFDNTDHVGFATVYPPEIADDPAARYPGKTGEVGWQSIGSDDDYGVVDIAQSLENYKGSAMYLVADFRSERSQAAQLRLGTQNAWKLWLNGEYLFGHEEYHRGMIMDQHRIPIQLQKGHNRILLKILQDEQSDDWAQSYEFQLRLTDQTGSAIHPANGTDPIQAPKPAGDRSRTRQSLDDFPRDVPTSGDVGYRARQSLDDLSGNVPKSVDFGYRMTRFRGPAATGQAAATDPPIQWDDANPPGWTAKLSGDGFSQPVVINNRVFTTCGSGFSKSHLHVLCHDLDSGRELWHRQYWASGRTSVPPDMRVATPTPVAMENRVYCLFSSGDLACLDHQGRLLWYRGLGYDYPNATNNLGMASSPLLVEGVLVCQMETDSAAFAVGLDAESGKNLWKISRLDKANWTSPIPHRPGNQTSVLLEGADGVQAVNPKTGEMLWTHPCPGSTVSSMTLAGDRLLVPADGLTMLQLGAIKDSPKHIWNNTKLACSFVSPVVAEGRVYIINNAGVLRCADLETGEMLWQARLHGSFWGTPSAAAGRLYCPSREGQLVIVDLVENPGTIIAEHEIGEGLFSPPVLIKDSILLRTDTKLMRIIRP